MEPKSMTRWRAPVEPSGNSLSCVSLKGEEGERQRPSRLTEGVLRRSNPVRNWRILPGHQMAEICCDMTSGREAAAGPAACEPTARAARRRRMEIRKFKFVSGVAVPPEDVGRKRQRLHRCSSAAIYPESRLELEYKSTSDSSPPASTSSSSSPSSSPSRDGPSTASCPKYAVMSVCGRRKDMEDAISVRPAFAEESSDLHFFGVFDGHGCSHVAVSCKDQMHELVAEELKRESMCSSPTTEAEWRAAMERSFARMDANVCGGGAPSTNCRCEKQTPRSSHVGSTAVVAVVTPDRVVVSNCGDSRAVLCRGGLPIPLSSDHKPDRPDELKRIEAANGRVLYWDGARVSGILAMSRAIGDSYLKPFVIAEPEVTVTERREEDECLILASDGLWDVVSNQTACQVARMCLRNGGAPGWREVVAPPPGSEEDDGIVARSDKACSDAALLLTKLALARKSVDNISVVVVDLKKSR